MIVESIPYASAKKINVSSNPCDSDQELSPIKMPVRSIFVNTLIIMKLFFIEVFPFSTVACAPPGRKVFA